MNRKQIKDFVRTYNRLSWAIQKLIDNNDMDEKTNRCFIISYIMKELAKKGLLKDSVNAIDFEGIYWSFWSPSDQIGIKIKDIDGKKVIWVTKD